MAERLDPFQNIVAVHWDTVATEFLSGAWATSLNPGTQSIFKAGFYNSFTSGADPQSGSGGFTGPIWPGSFIDECYYQESQDLEHGGPVVPQFVIIYHGTAAPSSGLIDLAFTTFDIALAVHGAGALRWNDPHAAFAPAPNTSYDVHFTP